MTVALSRRRLERLHELVAVTALAMAEAQARIADHLDEREKIVSPAERAGDYRMFLRELAREFEHRGDRLQLAEVLKELGPDPEEQREADEARMEAWALRNKRDAAEIRASRVRRVRSHLRWVEMVRQVLDWLPPDEARRVMADIHDDGDRSKLSTLVRQSADRWAAECDAAEFEGGTAA